MVMPAVLIAAVSWKLARRSPTVDTPARYAQVTGSTPASRLLAARRRQSSERSDVDNSFPIGDRLFTKVRHYKLLSCGYRGSTIQTPLSSSCLRYAALTRATRVRVPVVEFCAPPAATTHDYSCLPAARTLSLCWRSSLCSSQIYCNIHYVCHVLPP